VLAAVVIALTAVVVMAVATRVYERSLLRAGSRIAWLSALGLRREEAPAIDTVPQGA
jgi:hypothetical protein